LNARPAPAIRHRPDHCVCRSGTPASCAEIPPATERLGKNTAPDSILADRRRSGIHAVAMKAPVLMHLAHLSTEFRKLQGAP
jgi:hypothetical protein